MTLRHHLPVLAVSLSALVLAACGGSDGTAGKGSVGSPRNPVPAEPPKVAGATGEAGTPTSQPGFKDLVDRQRQTPSQRDEANPCALVTKAQAQAILGARLLDPLVAPQGPTCVYRDRSGARFVTVAIQSVGFRQLRPEIERLRSVDVGGIEAFCGVHGSPVLYVPLGRARVLSVNAECAIARRFTSRALPRLEG